MWGQAVRRSRHAEQYAQDRVPGEPEHDHHPAPVVEHRVRKLP